MVVDAISEQMQGRRNDGSRSRLPIIAPRHGSESSPSHHPPAPILSMSISSSSGEVPRTRLPPRSRSGCWTCRTRKVKCDEQRPTCGQCARLGHTCDYSPRLSFRDDTPRVVERMQEVSRAGSHVWDPQATTAEQNSRTRDDFLPPFADLTSDEDREKKAESVDPGTYLVIANPSSFAALPEYVEEHSDVASMHDASRYQFNGDVANTMRREGAEDPNTIILRTFQDPVRRPSVPTVGKRRISSSSPTPSHASASLDGKRNPLQESPQASRDSSMAQLASAEDRDAYYLQHYRTTISSYVVQLDRADEGEDIFEVQARTSPPLYHAMMALSALSLSHRHRIHNSDALEHYQKVPLTMRAHLQNPQDSYSDGALFAHFLLLLYEIAAAGHWEQNMWQSHIQQLLRIVTLRQHANSHEPHAFVIWYTCVVDTFAILSHAGPGDFISSIFENNLMPKPLSTLPPLNSNRAQITDPDEEKYFPGLLQLNQEVVLMAAQVGKLAQRLRMEDVQRREQEPTCPTSVYIAEAQRQLLGLYNTIKSTFSIWCNQYSDIWTRCGTIMLSRRVQMVCEHAYILYNTCIIYLHTSMYPGQMAHLTMEAGIETAACASKILQIAQNIITQERKELRYIVFPVFIAGFATAEHNDKNLALHLLAALDHYSYGGITSGMRLFLQQVVEKQRAGVEQGTGMVPVDWLEEMKVAGLRQVIFGI